MPKREIQAKKKLIYNIESKNTLTSCFQNTAWICVLHGKKSIFKKLKEEIKIEPLQFIYHMPKRQKQAKQIIVNGYAYVHILKT